MPISRQNSVSVSDVLHLQHNSNMSGHNMNASTLPADAILGSNRRQRILLIACLATINLLASVCFSLIAPFYPDEAASKDMSPQLVGLVFSSFEATIFLTSPLFGVLINQMGPRFMLIGGPLISGCCSMLFGVLLYCPSGTTYFVMCLLTRIVEAIGFSMYVTALFAVIGICFPDNVASTLGTLETFSGIGMVIGPGIGGLLYELGGFMLPFIVLGGTVIFFTSIVALKLPKYSEQPQPSEGSPWKLLTIPIMLAGALFIICEALVLTFTDPIMEGRLKQLEPTVSEAVIGLVFMSGAGTYALSAPFWGYISDRFNWPVRLIAFGTILSVGCSLLYGPPPFFPGASTTLYHLWAVIVGFSLEGIAVGCVMLPVLQLMNSVPRRYGMPDNFDTFGKVSALINSGYSFGALIGPLVGSELGSTVGFGWAVFTATLIFAASAVVMIAVTIVCNASRRNSVTDADDERAPIL